jgi:hypothetical protein
MTTSTDKPRGFDLTNLKILAKAFQVMSVVLFLLGGFGRLAKLVLPPPIHGSIQDAALGVVLVAIAAALLQHWNWLRFIPRSKTSRVYFEVVYSILLAWFITCSSWEDAFRDPWFPFLSDLTLQVRHALMLCSVPPLVGMSVDLLIAKWPEKHYKELARATGLVLVAAVIMIVGVYFV